MKGKCALYIVIFFLVTGFSSEAFGLKTYSGKVARTEKKLIYIRHSSGVVSKFKVNGKTEYAPRRMPKKGENISVRYQDKKGLFTRKISHVARTVTIVKHTAARSLSGNAVVKESHANIRSGPRKDYSLVGAAKKGDVLILEGQTGKWLKIVLPGKKKKTGWIYSGLVSMDGKIESTDSSSESAVPASSLQPGKPRSF